MMFAHETWKPRRSWARVCGILGLLGISVAVPAGCLAAATDTAWTQSSFQAGSPLYYSTCVVAGEATGCSPAAQDFLRRWPKEMSWTGNELLIYFNANAEDLSRGALTFELNTI